MLRKSVQVSLGCCPARDPLSYRDGKVDCHILLLNKRCTKEQDTLIEKKTKANEYLRELEDSCNFPQNA